MNKAQKPKVVAVVVSYNRKDLLLKTLEAIKQGSLVPDVCVVVDNCSIDGSVLAISQLKLSLSLDVVVLNKNVGGAGGFTVGMARALLKHQAELVWVMDDDTIPKPEALEGLVNCWVSYDICPVGRPAFVASRVLWVDGRDHPMNTPRQRPSAMMSSIRSAAQVQAIPVRSASFVSLLIDANAIYDVGLPIADYFLWNDDFEYSTRLARHRVGLYLGTSEVVHHTEKFGSVDADPGERFFWEVRNKIWLFSRSRSLSPAEKFLYGGATTLRWLKTFSKSSRKVDIMKNFFKGFFKGFFTKPRTNEETLADVYPANGLNLEIGQQKNVPTSVVDVENFSVLMSVYAKDNPKFFKRAFESVTIDQTQKPAEVVIVRDGQLSEDLEKVVSETIKQSTIAVVEISLSHNRGLAVALDAGLSACSYDIVARMDADDISLPMRFEKQLAVIKAGADVVGSALFEFSGVETNIVGKRTPPTSSEKISSYARFHVPLNHPTVVYRKLAVAAVGGYRPLELMEDYWLFARMISAGAKIVNLPEPLVLYRITSGSYARRGGLKLFVSEVSLQMKFLGDGFVTPTQWCRNLVVRGGYRLVPEIVRRKSYQKFIANRNK